MADDHLRSFLETLDPRARDTLRRVLIRHQVDRHAARLRLTDPPDIVAGLIEGLV